MPGIWFLASNYAPNSKDGNESEPRFGLWTELPISCDAANHGSRPLPDL